MNDELVIRYAESKDAEAVLEYLKIVGSETENLLFGAEGVPFTRIQEEKFIAAINASAKSCMILACLNEKIVGVASLQGSERERISHRAEIAVSVMKAHWGSGVGSGLMKELIRFAKSKNIEIISLEVKSDNDRAIRLYEKLGFSKFGTYKKFFKINGKYYDADYMNLYLAE